MFKHIKYDIYRCEVSFEVELSLYLKLSFKGRSFQWLELPSSVGALPARVTENSNLPDRLHIVHIRLFIFEEYNYMCRYSTYAWSWIFGSFDLCHGLELVKQGVSARSHILVLTESLVIEATSSRVNTWMGDKWICKTGTEVKTDPKWSWCLTLVVAKSWHGDSPGEDEHKLTGSM